MFLLFVVPDWFVILAFFATCSVSVLASATRRAPRLQGQRLRRSWPRRPWRRGLVPASGNGLVVFASVVAAHDIGLRMPTSSRAVSRTTFVTGSRTLPMSSYPQNPDRGRTPAGLSAARLAVQKGSGPRDAGSASCAYSV
jgi:hypothetical protein